GVRLPPRNEMRSAGKAACLEKDLLVRSARAAQDRVAVREASEAPDDVGMLLGIFREFSIAVVARQLQAALLVGEIFRMHQRQIEELPLGVRQLPVEAAPKGAIGGRAGELVGRVTALITAEHIAGELVEYHDERQRALRRLFPIPELAFAGGVPEGRKAFCDLGIEQRVLL